MWKTIKIIALVIAAVGSACVALLAYWNSYNLAGEKTIKALIPILEHAKQVNGSYPRELKETEEIRNAQVKIWGIFPSPNVMYRLSGREFDIYYYQLPLGPVDGYESKNKQWYAYD